MKNTLSLALAAALLAMPVAALAQDDASASEGEGSALSWNLGLTSSYMFRGVDQTDDHPALQGGLDFALDNGFYVGTWASNVDFGADAPDLEIDTYIGWSTDLSDDWNIDLMVNRYNYFGERDSYGSIDYNEYFANLSYQGMLTFTVAYANNYVNSGEGGMYYGVSTSHEVGDYTLDGAFGLSTFDSGLGMEDYMDWSIGMSRSFGPVNTSLMYTGTDSDGGYNFGELADDKIVLSFSIEG